MFKRLMCWIKYGGHFYEPHVSFYPTTVWHQCYKCGKKKIISVEETRD